MEKFKVVGVGINKKSGGKININFSFYASSYEAAKDRAKQEAEKKHPGYECDVHVE